MTRLGRRFSAFTLVEMTVVIAIIAILATLVVMSLAGFQSKSRDSRRKTDVQTYEAAIEKLRLTDGTFPPVGASSEFYGRMNFHNSVQGSVQVTQGGVSYPVSTSPSYVSIADYLLKRGFTSTIARDPSAPANDTTANKPDYVLMRCDNNGTQIVNGNPESTFAVWAKLENGATGSDVENTSHYCGATAVKMDFGYGTDASVFPTKSNLVTSEIDSTKYYAAGSVKLP